MAVQTKAEALQVLDAHAAELHEFGVVRVGLFGSFIRDHPHAASDVDLLVEFDPPQKTFDNFMQVALLLERVFERPVDLVTPESLSPHIGPAILREVEYATFGS